MYKSKEKNLSNKNVLVAEMDNVSTHLEFPKFVEAMKKFDEIIPRTKKEDINEDMKDLLKKYFDNMEDPKLLCLMFNLDPVTFNDMTEHELKKEILKIDLKEKINLQKQEKQKAAMDIVELENEIFQNKELIDLYSECLDMDNVKKIETENLKLQKEIVKIKVNTGIAKEEINKNNLELLKEIQVKDTTIWMNVKVYDKDTKSYEYEYKQVTTFTMFIKSESTFECNIDNVYEVEINCNYKIYKSNLKWSCFQSLKEFQKALTLNFGSNVNFLGTEDDFKKFKSYLNIKEYERKIGIDYLGFINDKIFIDSSNEVKGYTKREDIECNAKLFNSDEINKNELEKIQKHLFEWNTKINTIPIILFPVACMLNYKFKKIDKKLFHVFATGESGSGKSSCIEEIMLSILNVSTESICKCTSTKFAYLKTIAGSNIFPTVLEEYKPWLMSIQQKNTVSDILRSGYDRHTDKRGRQDQSVRQYKCRTPLVLVGEATPEETALQDRSIQCSFSKGDHNEFRLNSFEFLKENKKLLTKLGRSLLTEVISIDDNMLIQMFEKYQKLTNEFDMNTRKKEHITKLIICYKILEKVFEKNNLKLSCILTFDFFINTMKNSQEEVETYSIVEEILELFDRISNQFQPEWHYKIIGNNICIDFKNIYDKIRKYHKDYNIENEILTYKEFTKQLRLSKYFVKYSNQKLKIAYESVCDKEEKENSVRDRKCFCLDIKKLKNNNMFDNLLGNIDI